MSLIEQITAVRALQRDLRDVTVPVQTTRALQHIQECLRTGSDSNGWQRVDWRSRASGGGGGGGSSGHGHSHGGGGGGRGGGGGGGHYRNFGSRGGGGGGGHHGHGHGHGHGHNNSHSNSGTITMNRGSGGGGPAPMGGAGGPGPSPYRPNKYVSRFKSSSDTIDEAILNTIILGKLNKFSQANYDETKQFLCQILDSGETDFLKEFMKLVFQKAAGEEVFCPLYAKLLSELSTNYSILLGEMVILYREYMSIFSEVDESECGDYDEFVERTSQKKYRLGYSQFLAELVKHKVLDRDLLLETIRIIVQQVPKVAGNACFTRVGEEYAECLSKIIGALVASSDETICAVCALVKTEISDRIQPYTVKGPDNKLSMKARFALVDVYTALQRK